MLLALLACSQQRAADRWLALVVAGEDDAAFAELDVPAPPEGGFDAVRFGKRADRIGLREATDVRWEDERRSGVGSHLEGTFDRAGQHVRIGLNVAWGRVNDVRVAKETLVPRQTYVIVPDRRPLLPLEITDLGARHVREGLRVEGHVPGSGTMTVRARCLSEGVWVANALQGPVDETFSLAVDVPPGWPCQVELRHDDGKDRRSAVACASEGVVPGPCEPTPPTDPSGPPVVLSGLATRWDDGGGGVSVTYRLRAEVPQPTHGDGVSASITTRLACPGGSRPVVHTRPLDSDWLEPGVDRLLGSPMVVHAEGRPCELALTYVRDDDYDRLVLPLFTGCVAADGSLGPAPCP